MSLSLQHQPIKPPTIKEGMSSITSIYQPFVYSPYHGLKPVQQWSTKLSKYDSSEILRYILTLASVNDIAIITEHESHNYSWFNDFNLTSTQTTL